MVTSRRDYAVEAVAAARSVLVELVQLLGEFREQLVVVGGWVPVLLLADAPEAHVGTLDIDLALDFQRLPEASYTTLLRALMSRGYRQDAQQPFRFFRDVPVPGRAPLVVEVDLLAGEYGGTGPGHRTQPAQDTRARKARGCDLVFAGPRTVTVEGELPGGGRLAVTCRVAAIMPWLVKTSGPICTPRVGRRSPNGWRRRQREEVPPASRAGGGRCGWLHPRRRTGSF